MLFRAAYEEEAAVASRAADGSPRPGALQAKSSGRKHDDGSTRRRLLESAERHVIVQKIRAELGAGSSRLFGGAGMVESTAERSGEQLGAATRACAAVVAALCPVAAARALALPEPLPAPSHAFSSAARGVAEQPGAAHRGCRLGVGELAVESGGNQGAGGGGDAGSSLADLVQKIAELAQLAKVRGLPACCLVSLVRSPTSRRCKCDRRVEEAVEAWDGALVPCCSSGVRHWMLEQLRGLEREGQSRRQELRAGLLEVVRVIHLEDDGLG